MPYTVPTASEFKARHAKFDAVADGVVDALLAEASRTVTEDWHEDDYQDGAMYLAAHLIISEGLADAAPSVANTSGALVKLKADETEATFDTPGKRMSGNLAAVYGSTFYGRRFLEIAQRNGYLGEGGPGTGFMVA